MQRRKIARIIGEVVEGATPAKAPRAKKQGRKLGPVAQKYQLPTGETWRGRGRTPVAFAAWEKGAEGKAWRKDNAGEKFPAANGAAKSGAKSQSGVKKGAARKGRKAAVKKTRRPAKG
nr:H-NS family nucleoid-associated regulatory protein [Lysobacter sp. ESA13C]